MTGITKVSVKITNTSRLSLQKIFLCKFIISIKYSLSQMLSNGLKWNVSEKDCFDFMLHKIACVTNQLLDYVYPDIYIPGIESLHIRIWLKF